MFQRAASGSTGMCASNEAPTGGEALSDTLRSFTAPSTAVGVGQRRELQVISDPWDYVLDTTDASNQTGGMDDPAWASTLDQLQAHCEATMNSSWGSNMTPAALLSLPAEKDIHAPKKAMKVLCDNLREEK